MNATHIKILVSVFLVLATWRFFELPGVAMAFWSFVTIGAIPGTDKVLGTEALLRSLIVLFAVVCFLIFRKEFMASIPGRMPRTLPIKVEEVRHAEIVGKMVAAATVPRQGARERIIITLTRQQSQPTTAAIHPIVVSLARVAASIVLATCWVEAVCRQAASTSAQAARRTYRSSAHHTGKTAQQLYHWALVAGRFAVCTAILAWRVAEPHIRSFDRWLDKQLHANRNTAEALDVLQAVSRAARQAYQRVEQVSRRQRENK